MPGQCEVQDEFQRCLKTAQAKGLCPMHAWRLKKFGSVGLVTKKVGKGSRGSTRPPCTVDGCSRLHNAHGYCKVHGLRVDTHGDPGPPGLLITRRDPICSVEGCDKVHASQGFCARHAYRWKKTGDPGPAGLIDRSRKPCSVAGCLNLADAKGLCQRHYQRWVKTGDLGPAQTFAELRVPGWTRKDGYREVSAIGHPNAQKNGHILEHVLIMSNKLNRPLKPDESVHHKNGIRNDNRPENLELWTLRKGNQRFGQRVEDRLAHAAEMLYSYLDSAEFWPAHLKELREVLLYECAQRTTLPQPLP